VRGSIFVLALWIIAFSSQNAHAHPESFSNVHFTLTPSAMHVTLILPVRDLTRWFPPGKYKNYTADVVRELGTQAGDLLVVAWDEQPARPNRTKVHPGQKGFIIVEEDFGIPAGAASLTVQSALLPNLPSDHQELALVEDARRGVADERILVEETLTAQQDSFSVELPEVLASPVTASSVVHLTAGVSPKRSPSLMSPMNHPAVIAAMALMVLLLVAFGFMKIARGRGLHSSDTA